MTKIVSIQHNRVNHYFEGNSRPTFQTYGLHTYLFWQEDKCAQQIKYFFLWGYLKYIWLRLKGFKND